MKQKNLLKIALLILLSFTINLNIKAQSAGDIAFVGFNADGDKDFSIVVLADITNKTIYFSDNETNGTGGFNDTNEGFLTWSTGINTITAGSIVNFNNIDNESNPGFGVSIGTLSRPSGNFNITASAKDGVFAYLGSDENTPTTFIAAIQIGTEPTELGSYDGDGITLTGTGLVIGTSIIIFDDSATPDGAVYNASRSSQSSYSNYYTLINDDANNWNNLVNGDGETLIPFSQEAFTINTTNWTGATSSVWNLAGNWDNGIPTEDSNVIIPDTTNDPIITSFLNTGNITLNSNANLTITGSITNKGLTTINSGATLIATGTLSGSVNYNRALTNGSQWYYMSSPVIGENYNNTWVTNNSIPSSTQDVDNRGVSWYDNLSSDTDSDPAGNTDSATGFWRYMEVDTSTPFEAGRGYGIIRSGAGNVSFTGTGIYNSDQTFLLTQGINNFNLIGNPFTAFITLGTFYTTNSANIDTDFYFWNGSSYTTKTSGADSAYEIAPGQGFFVEATSAANVTFEIADASHQSTDTFQKTANTRPEINVTAKEGTKESFARFLYIDGTTKGYDKGYDGKLFGGVSHSFVIYSDLIESDGKKYQSQSLPNLDYENMVIPIGVIVEANKEITFSAEALNLPADINVYLEDRLTNTFTRLDEANSSYKITSDVALDGIGRFYLHTKNSSALSVDTVNMDNISIYKTTNSNLRIAGISQGKASIKLYSILGKQVFEDSFTSNGVQNITLPALSSGIYIVQLETETGSLNKKITLE